MPSKLLILTGAPESSSLDCEAPDLLHHFLQPFNQLFPITKLHDGPPTAPASSDQTQNHPAAWRSLPLLQPSHLPTGLSQVRALGGNFDQAPDFFTTISFEYEFSEDVAVTNTSQILSQFYDQSLVAHGQEEAAQAADEPTSFSETATTVSFLSEDTSFNDTERPNASIASLKPPLETSKANPHLSDVEDIPTSHQLLTLQPQTVVINLIVGVISIAASRTVRTRWGYSMSLSEILVGDETKAGFGVTFWLSPKRPSPQAAVLAQLRRQDVILLQNVVLHVFMKKVYGQSLRNDQTKVHLLYRQKLSADDTEGYYSTADLARARKKPATRSRVEGEAIHPQLEKTKKVQDWVLGFVSAGDQSKMSGKKRKCTIKSWDQPPDDTQ
jgi:hypothetical protein